MNLQDGTMTIRVTGAELVTPDIMLYTLASAGGEQLMPFSGGSHVVVLIPDDGKVYRNPYSLLSSPFDTSTYQIAVRREVKGRGGSRRLHDSIKVGDTLRITPPINRFELNKSALKHVLIAGGVGITPMLAQLEELRVATTPFELHYSYRGAQHGALARGLTARNGGTIALADTAIGERLNFEFILEWQPLGTHVYVCGPKAMVSSVLDAAHRLGWPESHIHYEEFVEQTVGLAFSATLRRSGVTIDVPPELSLLEAAEQAGVEVPYLCRGGACGHCETDVLELDGEILHSDVWLDDAVKAANTKMMPCISRAKCTKLVLDM
ncbi:MAG: PDR/VanB family oxidoreductase [Hyphomicrobium sp.]